jgi:hypothetical protein
MSKVAVVASDVMNNMISNVRPVNYTNILGNYTITHKHPCRCASKSKHGDLKQCRFDAWTTTPSKILKF